MESRSQSFARGALQQRRAHGRMKRKHILGVLLPLAALMIVGGGMACDQREEGLFPDPRLEAVIRKAVGKPEGRLYPADCELLTELDAKSGVQIRRISNLTGLEYCANLTNLNLDSNDLRDISLLARLTKLTTLSLFRNHISDVAPLPNLTNLTSLTLGANEISDITPLSSLTNLTTLMISSNRIGDASAVSALSKLTYLNLGGNHVSDVSPLSRLGSLQLLEIWGNEITDISPLSALTNLTGLRLDGNRISDISPLLDNPGLGQGDTIHLGNNPLDLRPGSKTMEQIATLRSRGALVQY